MAEFYRNCDVYQGYNYRKDKQTTLGFVTSLKIGDIQLQSDQTCKDPAAPETDLKVVMVLGASMWGLGITDGVYLSGQVSVSNKKQLTQLLYKNLTKVDVEFNFAVYDYDPDKNVYYKCMLPSDDAVLKGLLEKNGSDLNLSVADEPSREVQSPENYAVQVGIRPQPSAQTITIATSFSDKIVKSWGLTVAGGSPSPA